MNTRGIFAMQASFVVHEKTYFGRYMDVLLNSNLTNTSTSNNVSLTEIILCKFPFVFTFP